MTDTRPMPLISPLAVFAAAFGLAVIFVMGTGRVWEDYYITYRVAKNLATGHGMVFTVGERVHAFTSPLGTLLPALGSLLTLNSSDFAALWIFRLISIAAFAGAVTLVYVSTMELRWRRLPSLLLAGWLITDSKSLDFSTNGMETGLLLFFLAYSLWSLFTFPRRQWLHLATAWAGLMWTRPDGFFYIGGMALGALLFHDSRRSGRSRRECLRVLALSGLACAVIYLPWFAGAWIYYGTPVPHTIIAKAGVAGPKSISGALQALAELPESCISGNLTLDGVFMPANHDFGGWPHAMTLAGRIIACGGAFLWLAPFLRRDTRIASLAFCLLLAYLSYCPGKVAAWYLPGPAWLAFFALAGTLDTLLCALRNCPRWLATTPLAASTVWLAGNSWLTLEAGKQAAVEQRVVDEGNRRVIGDWLRENASPQDRVFLECLGYIGFYSGLKTYDFPGLSSPEVVQASRETGANWSRIITRLKPDWLVLRPGEVTLISKDDAALLRTGYKMARVFDATTALKQTNVRGRGVLAYDAVFMIFQRADAARHSVSDSMASSGTAPECSDPVEEAIVRIRHELEYWPENAPLLSSLGRANLVQGRFDEAIACYEQSLRLQPNLVESHFDLGFSAQQQGRLDEAVSQYQTALRIRPDLFAARNDLANVFLLKGRFREAEENYRVVLKHQPDFAEGHINLGSALLADGRLDEAISHYRKALEIQPGNSRAFNNLGTALLKKGQLEQASANYQRAVDIQPDYAEAQRSLGDILSQLGRADEALPHYQKAAEFHPDDVKLQLDLGILLFRKGRLDEVIASFRRLVKIQPALEEAHNYLANAFLQKRQPQEAVAEFEQVLRINPKLPAALHNLAWVLATCPDASVRNGAKAIDLARQANDLTGGSNPAFLASLAAAYAECGRFGEAIQAALLGVQKASAKGDAAQAGVIRAHLKFYESDSPLRDQRLVSPHSGEDQR